LPRGSAHDEPLPRRHTRAGLGNVDGQCGPDFCGRRRAAEGFSELEAAQFFGGPAAERRHNLASGASHWTRDVRFAKPRRGAIRTTLRAAENALDRVNESRCPLAAVCRPSGAFLRGAVFQGLTSLAKPCRRSAALPVARIHLVCRRMQINGKTRRAVLRSHVALSDATITIA